MRGRKKQYVQAEEEKKMKRIKEMGGRKEGGKVREWQRETEGENEKKEREREREREREMQKKLQIFTYVLQEYEVLSCCLIAHIDSAPAFRMTNVRIR